jgi:hypothetical protein
MKGYDPEGQLGPKKPLPDYVEIKAPVPDKIVSEPLSEQKEPVMPVAPPVEEQAYIPQEQVYQQQPEGEYIQQDPF